VDIVALAAVAGCQPEHRWSFALGMRCNSAADRLDWGWVR